MAEILFTAAEAYPAFERLVLGAKNDVVISMRVFDPETELCSAQAQAIGTTWADLIAHKIAEGVRFHITITDFDPVARPQMHRVSWRCKQQLDDAARAAPDMMQARVHMHPARAGWPHRIALAAKSRSMIAAECDRLRDLPRDARDKELAHMPGFRALLNDGSLTPRFWPPAPLCPASHHQKMAVIDGEVLYIGGLDLNERRYDDPGHDREPDETWHDIQVIVRDDRAAAARAHMLGFTEATEGRAAPPAAPGLLRTLSARRSGAFRGLSPRPVLHEIEDAHLEMIATARRFIYLETQFLRSTTITSALCEAAPRGIGLIAMIPAAPEDVAFDRSDSLDARYGEQLQADAIDQLQQAYGDRIFIGSPALPRPASGGRHALHGGGIIYIHAKLMVSDAQRAIVSSANLNGRSMRWDSETGIALDQGDAAALWRRALDHWFRGQPPADPENPASWARAAEQNRATEVTDRAHFVLPHDPAPARDMGQPLPGVPEEMV